MFLNLVIICSLCGVCWLYLRWKHVEQYWAKRGVPHLPPHPILGSLTFLQRKNPAVWMIDMYQRFRAPYAGAWWFWRPVLLVNSPELARNILVKDSANFRDRFLRSGTTDPVGALNLSTMKDPLWSEVRRRLTHVFTTSKLRAFQNLFDTKSRELVQRIRCSDDNSKINLRILFTDYTTDIIGTAAFGVKTNATLTGEDPMRVVTKAFMTYDLYRGLCWSSIFFFPELVDIFRFTMFPKWAVDYLRKVLHIASEQRKEAMKDFDTPRDLLDALLNLEKEGIQDMNEDVIVAQAAILLLGGYETTGSGISFACYELAFQPEMQDKLYAELNPLKNEDGHYDISELADLEYLNCIVKEILRKYTPMGWLDRVCAKDYPLDEQLTIPTGTPVYVNVIGMHHDEELFPEPLEFRPERFLPGGGKIKPSTYMPFGEGPRICIGQRFGLITMRHALANLVLNYKLEPLPDAPTPKEVEFEKRGLFLLPGQKLFLKFIPRN